jgi:aldose 1-epimerase
MKSSVLLLVPLMSQAAPYFIRSEVIDGVKVVRLGDTARHTEVAVAPSIGNIAYEMKVNGKNAFWVPFQSLGELRAKPVLCGNPFLSPWANRIDQDAFWANGKRYLLNPDVGNLRRDGNAKPIHGLLSFSPLWTVVAAEADGNSARVTSRLEFWKYPELMAQFPFAHTIEMTYRLAGGVLEVETRLQNHSVEPMPVGIGFHPYFQLHDAPRDQWKVHVAARERLVLSNLLIPTGERQPVTFAAPQSLAETQFDDVFTALVRSEDGKARFSVAGKQEKITVIYGPKYPVAVVYAPPGRNFICFEPMSTATNGFNLAHQGIYKELQSVPAGGEWRESYWVEPSGF